LLWAVRDGYRLRALMNRVSRKIFRPEREEVTGGWKKKCIMRSFIFRTPPNTDDPKSSNWLVKCRLKYVRNFFITY
jgi:hypothetical protein